MLLKTSQPVVIPAIPAVEYRPYSKECPPAPPPPHTKRWVRKKLCGTYTEYVFFAYYTTTSYGPVYRTVVAIEGLGTAVTHSQNYLADFPQTAPQLLSVAPYCVMAKVYE